MNLQRIQIVIEITKLSFEIDYYVLPFVLIVIAATE